ncbi:conserved hypothetical protein [Dickeya parazeae Ech586]|uniref:Uncharacterized protein n=1 Tax=Dickeya zeae (strain Ech586) TaxID=590409 RepID=D2BZ76_DICZ5|nr:hypothetical protein [Dickeya parazeae]ACZ76771.1 conserved hypothetical protein [Dickeya parazeae Ech586]
MFIENKPDEVELLSFFESEPVSFERDNISYLYIAKDNKGLSIDFSFSVVEGWIQYTMKLNGNEIQYNSIDGVSSFNIRKDKLGEYLHTEIITNEIITKVEIRVRPDISIKSSTLVR